MQYCAFNAYHLQTYLNVYYTLVYQMSHMCAPGPLATVEVAYIYQRPTHSCILRITEDSTKKKKR